MKLFFFFCVAAASLAACSDDNPSASTESDEESAQQFGIGETYDHTRSGARLILSYDSETNSFTGTATVHAVDVSGWTLADITVTPPPHSDSEILLSVTATATAPATLP